jgi:hypothetical protein
MYRVRPVYRCHMRIVSFLAVFCLAMHAAAVIGWSQAAFADEEPAGIQAADSSEPSSPLAFMPITLDDLRCAEDLTIVQDSNGPSVKVLEVCESVSDYADFEPNPAHEFTRSLLGRAWLYAEIYNISLKAEPDGAYRFSVSADIVVSDADARLVWEKDRAISFDQRVASPPEGVWAYAYVPTIFLRKGEYNVEITIHDDLSGSRSRVNTLVRIK